MFACLCAIKHLGQFPRRPSLRRIHGWCYLFAQLMILNEETLSVFNGPKELQELEGGFEASFFSLLLSRFLVSLVSK